MWALGKRISGSEKTWTLRQLQDKVVPQVEINGKWLPTRPLNYKHRTFRERLKEAWLVFRGHAEIFTWPDGQ